MAWIPGLQGGLGFPAVGRCRLDLAVISLVENQQEPIMAWTTTGLTLLKGDVALFHADLIHQSANAMLFLA